MNAQTERARIAGPAGALEVAIDRPADASRGVAVVAHPHPLHGGTMDNKVAQTLARAHVLAGYTAWRFNVRGAGGSEGTWDGGAGEVDDGWAVLQAAWQVAGVAADLSAGLSAIPTAPQNAPSTVEDAMRRPPSLALAGFSFGGYLASQLAVRARAAGLPLASTVLVGPAVVNFAVARVAEGSLVVQGGADEVVPTPAVLEWAAGHDPLQPVLVLPGVGHFFHGQLPLLRQCVLRHLQSLPA